MCSVPQRKTTLVSICELGKIKCWVWIISVYLAMPKRLLPVKQHMCRVHSDWYYLPHGVLHQGSLSRLRRNFRAPIVCGLYTYTQLNIQQSDREQP